MVFTTVNRAGLPIGMEGLAATSGANIKTMTQQLNQPASSYSASSYGTSTTGTSTGMGTSGEQGNKPVSGLGAGSSSGPASNYSVNTSTGFTHTTPPPIEGTPPIVQLPPSMYNQVVSEIPSVTKQLQRLAPATETTTTTPTGVAHLWIGWKIEPWEGEVIQKFIEAFEHGEHVHHPPIMLPMMGGAPVPGALVPMLGAPAPGAPVVTMQPQGAGNQQQLTV